MNILIVTSYYVPHLSGLTLYVKSLADALTGNGHRVDILTNRHSVTLSPEEQITQIKIHRLHANFHIGKSPVSLSLIKKSISLLKGKDLVILNLPSLESVPVALLTKLYRKKLLVIHHCDPIVAGPFGGLFTLFATISNFWASLLANKIVSYTKDYASHSPVLSHFLHKVVYVLPPIHSYPPLRDKSQQIAKLVGQHKFKIGFAGRFAADKGIAYLLEAIPLMEKKIQDFVIVFAGPRHPVGETYYNSLSGLLTKYTDRLIFLDSIDPKDMGSFYSNIDVLVLPSVNRTESFGMVQVEALLSKVPLVSSNIPGVRQVIKITDGGVLVSPKSKEEIAAGIIKVLSDKGSYQGHGLNLFSLQNFSKSISSLISSI